MDSNDCGFVFMPWRLAAAPENCRRPQPAPTRLHAQQKESLALVTNRDSVAELVAFVRFPLWRSHIVSPRSLHRSRLDDPLWQERAQYARGRALCGNSLSVLSRLTAAFIQRVSSSYSLGAWNTERDHQ